MGLKSIRPFSPAQWVLALGVPVAMAIVMPIVLSSKSCAVAQEDLSSTKEWVDLAGAYFPDRGDALARGRHIVAGCVAMKDLDYKVGDDVVLVGHCEQGGNGMDLKWEGVGIHVIVEPPPSSPIRALYPARAYLYGTLVSVDYRQKSISVKIDPNNYRLTRASYRQ